MWRWSRWSYRSDSVTVVTSDVSRRAAIMIAAWGPCQRGVWPGAGAGHGRAAARNAGGGRGHGHGFGDAAALAYLAEADRIGLIDLRAATFAVAGIAFPGKGPEPRTLPAREGQHGRCADIRRQPRADEQLPRGNAPAPGRTDGARGAGGSSDALPAVATEGDAVCLLIASIRAAKRPVTLITLEPLKNVAQMLERDPAIVARIERIIVEGGDTTGAVPANSLDAHDFISGSMRQTVQAVLRALPGRVFMSARNAADHVPLTAAFRERLAIDRTTPADIVYSIASDPLIVEGEQGGTLSGTFWWDPLAAVAATVRGGETFKPMHVTVVQSGTDEGRTVVDPRGTLVHFGVSASADRFHDAFIDVLNDRRPVRSRPSGSDLAKTKQTSTN